MAQNQRRMVYLKIWSSAQFSELSDKAKLLYIGTLTLADDDGRLIAKPSYLRGQIFPFDENISVSEILRLRNDIEKTLLFSVYSINNCEYIQHPNWTEYQVIRKDLYKKSTLPSRNATVTKPLQKRDTSKDKLSKDNTSDSTKVEYANIKNNKNKKMRNSFKYNEKNSSDTFEDSIDLDTGEFNKPKEPTRQKAINYIKDYFIAQCEKTIKIKPVMNFKQNIIIANLFKKGMKPSEITDVIDWWFNTQKDKTKIIQISICLSSYSLNSYQVTTGKKLYENK
jgi:hypothetical protein